MRRVVAFTVLATVLGVPAVALGVDFGSSGDDGTVSVKNGAGGILLSPFSGAAVARVAHGKIKITDPLPGDGDGAQVWGCDNSPGGVDLTDTTTVCTGDNLRFRAAGGRYKIWIKGSGIFLSAVGRGSVTLNGAGDGPTVTPDGVFSINDAPYRSLPDDGKTFSLAAAPGG
jgi:hypothetical protein